MRGLTGLVLSVCALFEAEGRLLQENILRTVSRVIFLVAGAGFAITALAFFIAGIYDVLVPLMPKALALACLGLVSAVLALILFWSSGRWGQIRKPEQRKKADPQ